MTENEKRYKISVRTLQNSIITFNNVLEYNVNDNLISFVDVKTGKTKIFSINNVEIEVCDYERER